MAGKRPPAEVSELAIKRFRGDGIAESPTHDSRLCDECCKLDLGHVFDDLPLQADKHYELRATVSPRDLSSEGLLCPICQIFRTLRHPDFAWTGSFRLLKLNWAVRQRLYTEDDVLLSPKRKWRQQVQRSSLGPIFVLDIEEPESTNWSSYPNPFNGKPCLAVPCKTGDARGIRARSDNVDFNLLKGWLSHCRSDHKLCNVKSNSEHSISLRLIDCHSLKIVKAAQGEAYVALSYVWGKGGQHIGKNSGKAETLSRASLPPLICDAIETTLLLGLQYLWIDRYCLSQNNDAERHEQISRMNTIYGNAELTIVALVNSPEDHIPGIPGSGVRLQRDVQRALRVGHQELLSSMSPPRAIIAMSTWSTRAWTLQEAVLSRRCLYLSHEQAYFECRETNQCETIAFEPTSEEKANGVVGPWPNHRKFVVHSVSDPGNAYQRDDLHDLLSTYFSRILTYDSDAINAFAGILENYAQETRPWVHHFGLLFQVPGNVFPDRESDTNVKGNGRSIDKNFVRALTWQIANSRRRAGFPTWSWSGWKGDALVMSDPFTYTDFESIEVKWVTLGGKKMRPCKAYTSSKYDIRTIQWSQHIILKGPIVDVELLFGSHHTTVNHAAQQTGAEGKTKQFEDNVTVIIESAPRILDKVLLACPSWFWSSEMRSTSFIRTVALRASSPEKTTHEKDDFLFVFGQPVGSAVFHRLGIIPRVGDAITERLPLAKPGFLNASPSFNSALALYANAPWSVEKIKVG